MHYRSSLCLTLLSSLLVFLACETGSNETSRRTINSKAPAGDPKAEGEGTAEGGTTEGGTTEGGTEAGTTEGGTTEGGETEGGTTEGGTDLDLYQPNEATWHQDTKKIFEDHCLSCHQAQYPIMNNYDSVFLLQDYVKETVAAGTMPPGTPLSPELKSTVIGWVLAGAKKGVDLSWANPTTDSVATENEFEIGVNIDAAPDAKWSLYMTTNADDTTGGTSIASDLSIEVLSVQWNVTAVPAGVYYIYATVTSGGKTFSFKGPGKITVSLPAITLAPAWKNGEIGFVQPATIQYTTANLLGAGTYAVRVEYKNGAGGTWTQLTDNAGLTEYQISPALPEGDDYFFRVTLLESAVNKAASETDKLIGLADSSYTFATVPGNCGSCHPGNGVLEKNKNVLSRITDAGSPMPPGGLLNAAEQLQVRLALWLSFAVP